MRRRQHKPRYRPNRSAVTLRARRHVRRRRRTKTPRRAFPRHLIVGLVALLVLGSAGYGAYWLMRVLHRSPRYIVRTINVEGVSLLTTSEVLDIAKLEPGRPILDYPIGQARRRLAADPMIRWASITRTLPNTLIVQVSERIPVARLDDKWLVDVDGYLLTDIGVGDKLPKIVVGVPLNNLEEGEPVQDERITKALLVIRFYLESSMPELFRIESVDVKDLSDVCVTAAEGPNTCANARFRLGGEDFGTRLARLDNILRGGNERLTFADLTHKTRVNTEKERP